MPLIEFIRSMAYTDPMENPLLIVIACVANLVGIAILIILQYVSRTRILRDRPEDRIYTLLVFGIMLGCATELATWFLNGQAFFGAKVLNHLANTYIFTFNCLLPFLLLLYVDLCLYDDPKRIWKHYKAQIFVCGAAIIATVVNFFVPIVYSIDEQNKYERGPFILVYYFVIIFISASIYFALWRFKRKHGARPFINFNVFLFPIAAGITLQFLCKFSTAWLAAAIGIAGLYMMQQNEMAYIDSLACIYNRQYLDHILSAWISRNRAFAGAMLDIDCFKEINDTYGHSEGDKVLGALAAMLKEVRLDNEWVFRFAGDEFIILRLNGTREDMDAFMERLNGKLDEYNRQGHPYRLAVSHGISTFESGDLDAFMKEMDDQMYAMKEVHHRAR